MDQTWPLWPPVLVSPHVWISASERWIRMKITLNFFVMFNWISGHSKKKKSLENIARNACEKMGTSNMTIVWHKTFSEAGLGSAVDSKMVATVSCQTPNWSTGNVYFIFFRTGNFYLVKTVKSLNQDFSTLTAYGLQFCWYCSLQHLHV